MSTYEVIRDTSTKFHIALDIELESIWVKLFLCELYSDKLPDLTKYHEEIRVKADFVNLYKGAGVLNTVVQLGPVPEMDLKLSLFVHF